MTAEETTRVQRYRGRAMRLFLAVAAGVLLLGLVAPLVDASFLRGRIQTVLERALGRKVQIGKVHFTLFAGPGFSLDDVTIAEDPRYGLEPFAFVETLEVRIRPDKLFFGRLQMESLRLVRPSLNLVKQADGTWNVVALLGRLSAPRRAPLNMLPAFSLSDARVDFKLGIRKTTFYVAAADLDLYPQRSGSITVRFAGSPARTDRSGRGFGHLRGEVTWMVATEGGPAPELHGDLALDPSDLSELTTLLEGYDIGLHGTVSTQAHVEGPVSSLSITGQLRVEDVHRWDLMPAQGENWSIRYRGAVDLTAQRLGLETLPPQRDRPAPVALRLRVNQFLSQTTWGFLARLDEVPAGRMLPLFVRLGVPIPEGLSLDGSLRGVIGYSSRSGFSGQVGFGSLTASVPGLAKIQTLNGTATIAASVIHLEPIEVELSGSNTVRASAEYNPATRGLDVSLDARSAPIPALSEALQSWLAETPVLPSVRSGAASGQLHYTHQPPAAPLWSGRLDITEATLEPPELSVPVSGASGRLTLDNGGFTFTGIDASAGDLRFSGDYRYTAGGPRHEHLRVRLESAELGQIEKLLEPALRSSTLLARLRLGRRSLPAWMIGRDLEGDLAIRDFSAAGMPVGPLQAHLVWESANVQLTSLALELAEGHVRARGSVNLAGNTPRYRFTGNAEGLAWKGGHASLNGRLETSGTGTDTLGNMRASGTLSGADWRLAPGVELASVAGNFSFSLAGGWPAIRLSGLKATQGDEAWEGSAASDPDGKLVFDLANGRRQLRVVSSVNPLPADAPATAPPGAIGAGPAHP